MSKDEEVNTHNALWVALVASYPPLMCVWEPWALLDIRGRAGWLLGLDCRTVLLGLAPAVWLVEVVASCTGLP